MGRLVEGLERSDAMATWDKAAAKRYEEWFQTREGAFALRMEKRLVQVMMSAWPRRGQSVLEVGCGSGLFLRDLWEGGFDVTGLDSSPDMLDLARMRLGPKADLHLGVADHMPFRDKEFDFVILVTLLEHSSKPGDILAEAARVARKGLVVGFLNRLSLYYLSHGMRLPWRRRSTLREANWFTPWEIRSLIRTRLGDRKLRLRSVLPGPYITWRDSHPWDWLNSRIYPAFLGAFAVARVDFTNERATTPLLLWKTQPGPTA